MKLMLKKVNISRMKARIAIARDGVTIKIPYGVDVLHRPALHPIFSYWVG